MPSLNTTHSHKGLEMRMAILKVTNLKTIWLYGEIMLGSK